MRAVVQRVRRASVTVEIDESNTVGIDESNTVEIDESNTVGIDESNTVGIDESNTVGIDESKTVEIDGSHEVVGAIGPGLCVLVGVTHGDDEALARKLAERLWKLRIFADDDGKMNLSVADIGGEVLVISQFTLYGDARKGNRPSYVDAARPEVAAPLIEVVVEHLVSLGATVATGRFGADMAVELVNDGPVTISLELV